MNFRKGCNWFEGMTEHVIFRSCFTEYGSRQKGYTTVGLKLKNGDG